MVNCDAEKGKIETTPGLPETSNEKSARFAEPGANYVEEEKEIAKAAFERAKVEIAAKIGALRDLTTQKEDAAKKITELQSKTKEVHALEEVKS